MNDLWETAMRARSETLFRMSNKAAAADTLKGDAINALSRYFSFYIRHVEQYDPDHSGPEDVADEFSEAAVNAAITLYDSHDYQRLPTFVISHGVTETEAFNPIIIDTDSTKSIVKRVIRAALLVTHEDELLVVMAGLIHAAATLLVLEGGKAQNQKAAKAFCGELKRKS